MSLRELTDPSPELVHRLPALPQVDLAHSMQVMRLSLTLFYDLDYSHRGLARMVQSRLDNDVVRLTAYANLEAETEIRRAYQKADLFREAFGRAIEIRREG